MPLTSISRTTHFRKVSLESGRDFKTLYVLRRRKFSLASTTRVLVVADETVITKRHIKTHQLSLKQSLASLFDNRMVRGGGLASRGIWGQVQGVGLKAMGQ